MGVIMKNGVAYGGYSVIYKNGVPYISSLSPMCKVKPTTITTNGTYNASSDGADGYSQVTVNVNAATEERTFTSNGTYTPSSGKVGMSKVVVNVNQATETKSITSNGTYTPSSGKIGFSSVTVNVNQSTETKSITSNGTYTPSSGKIGFSSVTVRVPQSSRVTLWTGSVRNNVSVSLSGYSWVYITVNDPSRPNQGITGGSALLQVNGSDGSAGMVKVFSGGGHREYATIFRATSSGISAVSDWAYDDQAALYLTGIYGISNLS